MDLPNSGIELGSLASRRSLYQLSYQGSPEIVVPTAKLCVGDGAGNLLSTPKALNVIKEKVQGSISRKGKMILITTTKSLQSCPTLCDPIDGSPPGSPVPGILQARTLE